MRAVQSDHPHRRRRGCRRSRCSRPAAAAAGSSPGVASVASSTTAATHDDAERLGAGRQGARRFRRSHGRPVPDRDERRHRCDGAKFSACMRKHGVTNFPDPNGQGVITIHSGMGIDPGSPAFESARTACQKLLPNGGQPTPAQIAQHAAADARLLGLHARARAQGLPRPVERRPPDPRPAPAATSTRATRRSRRPSRPVRRTSALQGRRLEGRRWRRPVTRPCAPGRRHRWLAWRCCWSPPGWRWRVTDPFAGGSPAANGIADNAAATSLTTVKRQDLSQQTQVSATLGYADASTVSVPGGTAPAVARAGAAVGGGGAADAGRRPACARAGAGVAGRRPAQGRSRLPRRQRRRERRLAAGRRKRRPVRNRRAGGGGGPRRASRTATGKVQADQRALSAAEATLAAERGLGGDVRPERGVHDAAEGRADRPARRAAVRDRRRAGVPPLRRRAGVARVHAGDVGRRGRRAS